MDYTLITAFSSVFIAALALMFERSQKAKAWYETFRELYGKFWNDEQMAQVRSWIACRDAYRTLQPTLEKRLTFMTNIG